MAAPRSLPGFYFDPVKNRYFPGKPPKSLQAPAESKTPTPHATHIAPIQGRHAASSIQALAGLKKSSWTHSDRLQTRRQLEDNAVSFTSLKWKFPAPHAAKFGTFATTPNSSFIAADVKGVIHSCHLDGPLNRDGDLFPGCRWWDEIEMPGEITSLHVVGRRYIATSLEAKSRILIGSLETPLADASLFIHLPSVHDIWSSHFENKALSLAVKGGIAHLSDIDQPRAQSRSLGADAMSIYRSQDLLYAGLRNGCITRSDLRTPDPGQHLLKEFSRSPVLHVSAPNDWSIFASRMNGELHLYDLRQLSTWRAVSNPVTIYSGHVNTHSRRLGIAHDSSGKYLFAAGEDGIVRAWNMQTGRMVRAPGREVQEDGDGRRALLATKFEANVPEMRISTSGQYDLLHIAVGRGISTYEIGRRPSLDER